MLSALEEIKLTAEACLAPPVRLRLEADEVHIWRVDLMQSEGMLSKSRALLSEDERARADRFIFQKDRDRYSATRAALRDVLSRYLSSPASEIKFCHSDYGKPALEETSHGLSFNVAHSNDIALAAVAQSKPVGIDIEQVRADYEFEKIAEVFFSEREVSVLKKLPGDSQPTAFFNYWTHKEAYIKARGEGLSHPLNSFAVCFAEGGRPMIVNVDGDLRESSQWSLFSLSPGAGYVAALAVEGRVSQLKCWQWPAEEP